MIAANITEAHKLYMTALDRELDAEGTRAHKSRQKLARRAYNAFSSLCHEAGLRPLEVHKELSAPVVLGA